MIHDLQTQIKMQNEHVVKQKELIASSYDFRGEIELLQKKVNVATQCFQEIEEVIISLIILSPSETEKCYIFKF